MAERQRRLSFQKRLQLERKLSAADCKVMLQHIPMTTRIIAFVSISAIAQFFGDIVLEALIHSGSVDYLPTNWSFLALVSVSALTAWFSWLDARLGNLKQYRHEVISTIAIEALLVACEVETIAAHKDEYEHVWGYRMTFLVLTILNVILMTGVLIYLEKHRNKLAEHRSTAAFIVEYSHDEALATDSEDMSTDSATFCSDESDSI